MDPSFWTERWQRHEIGFHRPDVHDLLAEHWPRLGLDPQGPVFVPLSGKSLDMAWLAERGHRVVGVELSDIAIDEFFAERGLQPAVRTEGRFEIKSAGAYELWRGDIFDFPQPAVAEAVAVYDRAALIAFPPAMQERYAAALKALTPAAAPILLITIGYEQSQMSGPPFAVGPQQVLSLFEDVFEITEVARREALEQNAHFKARGLTALEECAYVLRRR